MYTAFSESKEVDTSFDIWKGEDASEGGKEFTKFRDAKRWLLADIDAEIAHLKRRRKYIASMKKGDVWEPPQSAD